MSFLTYVVTQQAFPKSGTRDYNYKKMFSLSFMAVADAKQRFITVESGASGSRGDSNIFSKSDFGKKLRNDLLNIPSPCPVEGMDGNLPFMFIGDAAYTRTTNFQTAIKGKHLPVWKSMFNYRLSRARRSVENAFGILQSRFIILQGPIHGNRELVKSIILACIALHNFHLNNEETVPPAKRKYRPPGYSDYIRADGTYIYGRWRQENPKQEDFVFGQLSEIVQDEEKVNETSSGQKVKGMLMDYFINNPVSWQFKRFGLL